MTLAAFTRVILVLVATAGGAASGEDTPPPKVTVAAPVEQTVTSYFEATGNTAAVNSVDLVARVQGFVEEISYTDGAFVKKRAPLFIIEPELYRLKVERAKSSVARAQAKLTQAEADLKREAVLIAKQSTSQAAYDRAVAQLDSARADLQSAQDDEKEAEINLGYTKVTAPFDGFVTARQVSLGQLVFSADAVSPTVLATVVQFDPIYVTVNVRERDVLRIRADLASRGQTASANLVGLPVEVGLQSEGNYPHTGKVDYTAPSSIRQPERSPYAQVWRTATMPCCPVIPCAYAFPCRRSRRCWCPMLPSVATRAGATSSSSTRTAWSSSVRSSRDSSSGICA